LSLPENKADLADFLLEELCLQAPADKEVVVGGGFRDEQEVRSSKKTTDLYFLRFTMKAVATCCTLQVQTVVVSSRDTDTRDILSAIFPVCSVKTTG